MKYIFLLAFFTMSGAIYSQSFKPTSISAAYFAESMTHPGVKLALNYEFASWKQSKARRDGKSKTIESSFSISPSLGFFYHKDYQTGFFAMPEFGYTRKKVNGNFVTFGLGAGYMRTIIPDVYDLNSDGEAVQANAGYNYFLTNYFFAFGKDLSARFDTPLSIYVKPQFMYALPGTPKGVWYFAAELGVSYRL